MKVFFSCSTNSILLHKAAYETILKTIKDEGHELTRDWLGKSIELASNKKPDLKRGGHYSMVMSAIIAADLVIFDGTVQSMSIGHQLTFALDKSKPTLLLANTPEDSMKDFFISGSKSSFLTMKSYKEVNDLPNLVKDFLHKNSSKSKVRFQIVLDKSQHDFIEWASFEYKRNKSDLIKKAIDASAEKDEDYQNHLSNQP